jgi:hypothetical protein
MIRATLTAACLASPALACDLGGSFASAVKIPEGAQVYVRNNRAPGPSIARCKFFVKNVGTITVGYVARPAEEPDSVYIVAPPGFMAVPPEAVLQEHAVQYFIIVPELLG